MKSLESANLSLEESNINLDTIVGELGSKVSGGQLQRIAIARALYFESRILIFDESTNALDEENEKIILDTIKKLKQDKIIILISHKKKSFTHCDRLFKISDKKIIEIDI